MSQLIGLAIDLAVGELFAFKDDSRNFWRPLHLLLDQLVHTSMFWIITLSAVPGQQLVLLGLAEHGQVRNPLAGIGDNAFEQGQEMLLDARHSSGTKQIHIVAQVSRELAIYIQHS